MNNSEGQTQEPVGWMKTKEEIIRDLKSLRNYFGSHDKTMEEHRLYAIADKLLKHFTSAAPPSPVGIDPEKTVCKKCNGDGFITLPRDQNGHINDMACSGCDGSGYVTTTVGIDELINEFYEAYRRFEKDPDEGKSITYANVVSRMRNFFSASLPQSSTGGLPKLDQPILDEDDIKGIIDSESSTEEEKE